jgi:hypothetical protein
MSKKKQYGLGDFLADALIGLATLGDALAPTKVRVYTAKESGVYFRWSTDAREYAEKYTPRTREVITETIEPGYWGNRITRTVTEKDNPIIIQEVQVDPSKVKIYDSLFDWECNNRRQRTVTTTTTYYQ